MGEGEKCHGNVLWNISQANDSAYEGLNSLQCVGVLLSWNSLPYSETWCCSATPWKDCCMWYCMEDILSSSSTAIAWAWSKWNTVLPGVLRRNGLSCIILIGWRALSLSFSIFLFNFLCLGFNSLKSVPTMWKGGRTFMSCLITGTFETVSIGKSEWWADSQRNKNCGLKTDC